MCSHQGSIRKPHCRRRGREQEKKTSPKLPIEKSTLRNTVGALPPRVRRIETRPTGTAAQCGPFPCHDRVDDASRGLLPPPLFFPILDLMPPVKAHSGSSYIVLSSLNPMLPDVAPPRHVAEREPVGHLNLAARTHSSHRILEMLIVAPGLRAVRVNFALPRTPVVTADELRHFVLPTPEIPSHIAS